MNMKNPQQPIEVVEDNSYAHCSILRTSDIINKILESHLNFSESSETNSDGSILKLCKSSSKEVEDQTLSTGTMKDSSKESCISEQKDSFKPINVKLSGTECTTIKSHNFKVLRHVPKKRKKFVLGSHIEITNGSPPQYRCKVCNCTFKQKHQASYHAFCPSGEKPYKCDLCGQSFVRKFHLDYHIRTHTGETPFHCSFCGKGFKQKDKVKRHEHIHTGASKSVCEICNKVVSSSYSLKMHYKSAHLKEKPHVCECGKSFATKAHLERHQLSHSSTREFVCDACGKAFIRRYSLIDHLKRHSERIFSCEKCSRKFKIKTDLIRHKYTHIEEPDFECKICNMKFRRKDNMDRHLKNTHPEASAQREQNIDDNNGYKHNNTENIGRNKTNKHETLEESAVMAILEAMLDTNRNNSSKVADVYQPNSVITHTKFIVEEKKEIINPREKLRESVIKFHKL